VRLLPFISPSPFKGDREGVVSACKGTAINSNNKIYKFKSGGNDHYDNYDAIDVPYSDAIPSDYEGVMGVPISFLDKICFMT